MDSRLDAIGFGSLNLDEFWEVPREFLQDHGLAPGEEYVRDLKWFDRVYGPLSECGTLKAADPGGSAANMIAALRRMGFRTGFIGATGLADAERLRLHELGDEQDLAVKMHHLPAGRCLALIVREDASRDRTLVILPNANDLAGAHGLDDAYMASCRWLHFTSFVSDRPLMAQARLAEELPNNVMLSFDPGAVYVAKGLSALEPIIRRSSVMFVTEEELTALTKTDIPGRGVSRLLGLGVRTLVLKLGSRGLSAYQNHRMIHQDALPAAVVTDRTGAGDVAAAGFIAGLTLSLDLSLSLRLAAEAASRSIEGYGRSSYPDRTFLESFLLKTGRTTNIED